MPWMMLTPRELEAITQQVPADIDTTDNAAVLRMVQAKIVNKDELELTDQELQRVRVAAGRYRHGFEKAFKAVLSAYSRHD